MLRSGSNRIPTPGRKHVVAMLTELTSWARSIKRDTVALYFAARDPRTPWYAKLLSGVLVAYALSPIDLIPDFVPILGYLDDLLLLPLGIWVAIRLIPRPLMEEHRARAATASEPPVSKIAAAAIVVIWAGVTALIGWWAYSTFLK